MNVKFGLVLIEELLFGDVMLASVSSTKVSIEAMHKSRMLLYFSVRRLIALSPVNTASSCFCSGVFLVGLALFLSSLEQADGTTLGGAGIAQR
ncbi:MAG: hypothetical protein KDD38_02855 [Bdellovibrionales bacterium]|nr:hypothetical protein [Bdellovibrionales bacterium]